MGRFVNSGNGAFQVALNSEIYVDKTELLEYTNRVQDTTSKFICNSRPRRFGKSITADMLTAYYGRDCDSEEMFSGLAIGKSADFRKYLNQYDVIHFDMQWCMEPAGGPEHIVSFITQNTIQELKEYYPDIAQKSWKSLPDVLSCIHAATGRKFVVIIDEFTMLNAKIFDKYMGFTEEEVEKLCEEYQVCFDEVKGWYDGYLLGDTEVYNPKAVVEVLKWKRFQSYWSETGTYEVIVPLLNMDFDGLKTAVIEMLAGGTIEVDVSSFQNDMTSFVNRDDVLTYLIHLGYLGYDQRTERAFIPNEEIRQELMKATKRKNGMNLQSFIRGQKNCWRLP